MRWAVLADVHANLEALEAVLADADAWGAEAIVCAGDLVGYGADPEACIARLRQRGAHCISGNHEGMVLGRIGFERCVHAGIRAALWTARTLSDGARAYLAALPATLRLGAAVVVCHGSLDDPEHYLASPRRADAALAQLAARYAGASVLICGHTHQPLFYAEGGPWHRPALDVVHVLSPERRWLVNPGAVGQSRDATVAARYVRFEDTTRSVTFRELAYDQATTRRKMRRAGLVARVAAPPPSGLIGRVEALRTRWARYRVDP